jgi:hypothetical protein
MKESNNINFNHEIAQNKILFMKKQTERNTQELKMKERTSLVKEWERVCTMTKNLRGKLKEI